MTLVSDHMDTTNPAPNEAIPAERVWEIIKAIDIAMLVTRSGQVLQGRPMSTIPKPDEDLIYILTEAHSSAAKDIQYDGQVLLSYQGGSDHVALRGTASVNPDKDLVKRLWNPGASIFWPDGPEANHVVALVIDPGHCDVWDGKGLFRGIASIVKGVVTGTPPDLGTRGAVDL